jgi:hypothetical protein
LNDWRRKENWQSAMCNKQYVSLLLIVGCLLPIHYASFFSAATAGVFPVVFLSLAALDLPKEPLNIFPFFVFLSPLPIIKFLVGKCNRISVLIKPAACKQKSLPQLAEGFQ